VTLSYIYTGKEAVKVAKQVEKTKRKLKVQETKAEQIATIKPM
jgi:hypothetical protein